jgi:hypothetical protein
MKAKTPIVLLFFALTACGTASDPVSSNTVSQQNTNDQGFDNFAFAPLPPLSNNLSSDMSSDTANNMPNTPAPNTAEQQASLPFPPLQPLPFPSLAPLPALNQDTCSNSDGSSCPETAADATSG